MYDKLPAVSVIIPTYNYAQFIRYAIESILAQTYPKELIEIIVVDDGSTDNTREILRKYGDRITYIYQDNRGPTGARNTGLSIAGGEIISFLDADDIWHKERLQRVVNAFLENPEAGTVYHPVELIDSNNVIINKNFYKAFGYREGLKGWITNEILSSRIFVGASTFAFKKNIIDRIVPIPEEIIIGEDLYLAVMASSCAPVEYIPVILGKYRLHANNTTLRSGRESCAKLAFLNKNCAYARQIIIEKLSKIQDFNIHSIDMDKIKRMKAKEMIFYHIFSGKRFGGLRYIPEFFRGSLSAKDILRGSALGFMLLCVPSFIFIKIERAFGLFKRKIRLALSA